MEEPDLCAARPGTLVPEILSVEVKNVDGGSPSKGDRLRIRIEIDNTGTGVGPISVTPKLDSARFSDYTGVPVGTTEVTLCEGTTFVEVEGGPFFDRDDVGKHYALGAGAYTVSSIDVTIDGVVETSSSFEGNAFEVGASNALLVPVVYDESYFEVVQGLTTDSVEAYLHQAFTRSTQLFTPSSNADPDGAGTFEDFPGGFDEMMNVRHLFRTFPGFPGESTTTDGWCEDATYYGRQSLGMAAEWASGPQETKAERHGFDYLLAISPGLGGGVACGWIDVQVSGLINLDVDRQQIVTVHETAHIFGAPHCDDVGNGEGGPLQNYVMCSGEKHANYPEQFVFHSTSRALMSSKWN